MRLKENWYQQLATVRRGEWKSFWPGRHVLRALSSLGYLQGPVCVCSADSFTEINETTGNFLERMKGKTLIISSRLLEGL